MACAACFRLSRLILLIVLVSMVFIISSCEKAKDKKDEDDSQKWKKKKLQDYSDADLERLYDQWEENDEDELEEDELPEWKKKPPQIDLSQADTSNPESLLKLSKKGKSLMMFATVSGNPTEKETEQVTQLWQSSLHNANIDTQRYVVGEDRVIFMLKDGAKAWEIKDFLVQQDRCSVVTIEGQDYPGKAAEKKNPDKNRASKKDTESKKKSKESKNDANKIKKEKKVEL